MNPLLLQIAKLDFNLLQGLHQEELRNQSRINLIEEGVACGLKRRIVQVRSRNDLLAAHHDPGTASTKMLLKESNNHGDVGDADSHSPHVHNNVLDAAPIMIKEPPVQQQIREKELADQRLEKSDVRLSNCESPILTKKMGSPDQKHAEKETYNETDDDEYDDEGRRISNCDGATLIGSPSFREYCVDYESDHDVVNHGDDSNGGNKENRTQGMDNLIRNNEVCIRQEPKNLEKKGSRGSKFRKVFPMHKTRYLWNVTTCYSRNNHHVPAEKLPEKLV